ncbi:TonB-dependent receptor family protein [Marinobacter orientalis]|uniref:TonB-dependent receptor n=1 Tax=Marinobacter orientalis TaxID=1928859 RepID=A0A7Y0RAH4_9GAMM|nr:TonB-dependent receptor [Marinobacter orientalis]NMT62027.1 TonB-dependent receptor [Marinobacter orientalis]TGX50754.1 TonB-dependent receptor [Marinobacter orientalis]
MAIAIASTITAAQENTESTETVIEVTSPRLVRDLYDTPAAVSVINAPDIQQGQQRLQLDESLDTVPGLFFQNRYNFAQNLRLSTRGFGARAPFGIRGIRIQVDGIPYTLPDGQSQIDAVDLDSAQRIEVIRGPSSVQYGNASGGVIDITTARGDDQPPGTRLRQDVGSDDYYKTTVQANGSQGGTSGIATMSWLNYNGYRDQSEVEKGLFNSRLSHEWGEGDRLTATFNALHTPKAEDPAGLTAAQVEEDRRQATTNAERLDSGQEVDQQTLGLLYETPGVGAGDLTVSTFFTRRDFAQQLPFPGPSGIAYDRQFYGISSDYQQHSEVAGLPLTWLVGADLHRQVDERRRYRIRPDGGVAEQIQEETQNGTTAAVFAQGDLAITDRFNFSLGTRFDRLRLSIDDDFLDDGDDSGSRTFDELSGFAGVSYRMAPRQQVYATIGTAFEAPTFTEFANPDGSGGFNPDIEPQQALNREIGVRGGFGEGFSYDLALFSIRVDDELLPFEEDVNIDGVTTSRTFYENAGRTQRNGVELGLSWDISYAWRITSALTLADYTFEDFVDEQGNDADGNRLPGLPREQWVTEVEWKGQGQRFAALEWQYVGDLYAENSNQTKVPDYWLFGVRAGDMVRFGAQSLNLYGGVRNLLDEDYFSNIRINANRGAFFEPAPGRTFYAGLEWVF